MSEELESCPSCGALPCDWVDNPHASSPPSLHREPIEADREAAAEVFAKQFGKEAGGVFAIRTGERDDHYLVQAFMRHRLAFSTPAATDAAAVRRELMDRARNMMGMLADLREAVDLDDESASEVLGYCDDLETAVHNIGAVASHIALPLPKAGEMETETAFEIWEDNLMVASASTEAEGLHYFAVYSQDGPVKLVRAETVRQVIATPSTEGRNGEDQADG